MSDTQNPMPESSRRLPRLPIPQPLRGAEIGTFAHSTVTIRLPNIARRVIAENDFPPDVIAAMEELIDDIPASPIRPLRDRSAPDVTDWDRYTARHAGENWLEIPWFFAETYFYRRILEATGYFQDGPGQGKDPYVHQKRLGLDTTQRATVALCARLQKWVREDGWRDELFAQLIDIDLWGNQADLSLWPADQGEEYERVNLDRTKSHVLVDDSDRLLSYLDPIPADSLQVDFIIDNAGFELVTDLAMAVYLLSSRRARRVVFHLKSHPTFVSDAMAKDIQETVTRFRQAAEAPVRWLGNELTEHLAQERLHLTDDFYWTSPLSGWEMPEHLRAELSRSQVAISKGDANYRRLLGDRHWPFATPFEDILAYFPTAVLALRTLKSQITSGISPVRAQELDQLDPDWLTNGHWGVIQFAVNS